MTNELIREMAERLGRSGQDVEKALNAFSAAVNDRLEADGEANLAGLGVIRQNASGRSFEASRALEAAVNYRWESVVAPTGLQGLILDDSRPIRKVSWSPLEEMDPTASSPASGKEPPATITPVAPNPGGKPPGSHDPEKWPEAGTDPGSSRGAVASAPPVPTRLEPVERSSPPDRPPEGPVAAPGKSPAASYDPVDPLVDDLTFETLHPGFAGGATGHAAKALSDPGPGTDPSGGANAGASEPDRGPHPSAASEPDRGPHPSAASEPDTGGGGQAVRSSVAKPAPSGPRTSKAASARAGRRPSRQASNDGGNRTLLYAALAVVLLAIALVLFWPSSESTDTEPDLATNMPATENVDPPANGTQTGDEQPGTQEPPTQDPSAPATTQDPPNESSGQQPISTSPGSLNLQSDGYTLIVGSSVQLSRAQSDMERYADLGLPVGILSYPDADGSLRHRIAVGEFATAQEADSAREARTADLPEGTWVRRIKR